MLASSRRLCVLAARSSSSSSRLAVSRTYSSSAPRLAAKSENAIPTNDPNPPRTVTAVSETNATPMDSMGAMDGTLQETPEQALRVLENQAPNRKTTWAKSQRERADAMSGPRFEQTIMEAQPQPYAAISLIHKQPVRWTDERIASCDGGGGPLGHPRVFINVDKPQICPCEYCGLPFAHQQHRKHLESLPRTPYPLESRGDAAEVNESQRITDGGFEQR